MDEYVESTVRPYLMDVIYCWSKVSYCLLAGILLLDVHFYRRNHCVINSIRTWWSNDQVGYCSNNRMYEG